MSSTPVYDSQAILEESVISAYKTEGYLTQDGKKDGVRVREIIVNLLSSRKVLGKQDLANKATTRGEMVEKVFPRLPGPEAFDNQPNPQLAAATWKRINSVLWGEVKTDPTGIVQQLVGLTMGNGYFLCRTKVSKDQIEASYVTDNLSLVERDFLLPSNLELERALRRAEAKRALAIMRQPQYGKRFVTQWDSHVKTIASASRDHLQQTLEAATAPEISENGESNQDEQD